MTFRMNGSHSWGNTAAVICAVLASATAICLCAYVNRVLYDRRSGDGFRHRHNIAPGPRTTNRSVFRILGVPIGVPFPRNAPAHVTLDAGAATLNNPLIPAEPAESRSIPV